ncbi:Zn-ribbon containing protein [Haladaptatus sp. DYF46]|uniref:OapC/ArvC family zinc-ribbon domain-containing protein n=1 Tax=Haladaptatus sp. DYF46 TaxID=2886041 RepID=UPI001E635A3C|nr:Zn-ribbon containing protein [Haladaptatus sp. DYF46]
MPHKCTNCGRTFADGSKEMLSGCPDCGGNKFQFRPSGSSPDETTPPESAGANENPSATADSPVGPGTVGRAANTVKGWVGSRGGSDTAESDRGEPVRKRKESTQPESTQPQAKPATAPEQTVERQTTERETEERQTTERGTEEGQSAEKRKQNARTETPQRSAEEPAANSNEDSAQANARSEIVPEDELPERSDDDGTGTVIKPPEDDQPSLDELREELNSQFESIKVVEPGQYELNLMELYERDEYIIAMRENGRYVIQVPDSWTGAIDS